MTSASASDAHDLHLTELKSRLSLIKSRLLSSLLDSPESDLVDQTFNQNMFNMVLQFSQDAAPDVDPEELLIFLKAGKSAQVKSVIDRFGRLFVEEFRHFMKLNSLTQLKMPPVKLISGVCHHR